MGAKRDLTGLVFGRLTVLNRNATRKVWSYWDCVCSCGKAVSILGPSLTDGNTQSCGCFRKEASRAKFTTHGMTRTPEHHTWLKMWDRCRNPNNASYEEYKHRTPPDDWKDFEVFYRDLGPRPTPQHSLDRIKNELPYGPGNCKWSTKSEQSRNRSHIRWFEIDGKRLTQSEFAKYVGVSQPTISRKCKTETTAQIVDFYRKK